MNNSKKPRRGRKGPRPSPKNYRIRDRFQFHAVKRATATAAAFYILVAGIGDFRLREVRHNEWEVRPLMFGQTAVPFTIQATDHETAAYELIHVYL
jgi:hypothetical protein